jgi:hypothetical protein
VPRRWFGSVAMRPYSTIAGSDIQIGMRATRSIDFTTL